MKSGSITKLRVWQKAKQLILNGMNNGQIVPERAERILSFIKKTLKNIDTIEGLGMYLDMLEKRFPELKLLIDGFKMDEQEKFDEIIGMVLEKLMSEGHFELSEQLIEKIKGTTSVDEKVKTLKEFTPAEFELVYKEIFEA